MGRQLQEAILGEGAQGRVNAEGQPGRQIMDAGYRLRRDEPLRAIRRHREELHLAHACSRSDSWRRMAL
jgi:hypothetical protein